MADTIVVETTGDFMAQDPSNGQVVEAYGATEVENTSFIQSQITAGRLRESDAKDYKSAQAPAVVETLVETPVVEEEDEEDKTSSKTPGRKKKSN